jgi:anti-sigma B factor antagonist
MDLTKSVDGNKATIKVTGKLTVATSPDLEAAIRELDEGGEVVNYDLDFTNLDYISSAGLRVLVSTQKISQRKGGGMRILHPTDEVMEVLEMTGLSDVLTIER